MGRESALGGGSTPCSRGALYFYLSNEHPKFNGEIGRELALRISLERCILVPPFWVFKGWNLPAHDWTCRKSNWFKGWGGAGWAGRGVQTGSRGGWTRKAGKTEWEKGVQAGAEWAGLVSLTQRKGSNWNGQIHFSESILLLEFCKTLLPCLSQCILSSLTPESQIHFSLCGTYGCQKNTIPCAVYKQPRTRVEGVLKNYILVRCSLGKYSLQRTAEGSWWQWLWQWLGVMVDGSCW